MRGRRDQEQVISAVAHAERALLACVLERSTLPHDAAIQLVFARLEDHAESRAAVDREADHHGKLTVFCDELFRAVEWIDVPNALYTELGGAIVALFRNDGVARKRLAQAFDDVRVRPAIGFGDGVTLALAFERHSKIGRV